ncbi:MAG: TRAP transporter substrate-binding protein [Rhodospirillales bacterium]|jgi:TRAP-type C4-dicarboxylate transport system substrate-binding protein|nr:hypothetical protein [Rhodospirillaceae bacterium]MDP6430231.1 TRAP transporter substrate-binding protein [Rhodospirillales bacterium]MDP6646220.1 TRAP transporter substrate-binding protein [Rhodospirillales bacterium]MDP6840138.1 TRAP transporter substrate-binding protein [Rhodospirillales bacterium]
MAYRLDSKIAALSAGAMIVALGAVPTAAEAETEILFNTYYSQKHPIMRGTAKPFAEGVAKATNGRVKVKFPAATLASPKKQWGMLTGGIADATSGSISWIRKRVKLTEIAALPFMVPSARGASIALWRTHVKFFDAKNEYKGVKLLSLYGTSGSQLHNNKRAIRKLADFKGLKVRTSGSGVAVFKALGATPVKLSGPKIFENFSKGVVDGVATPYVAVGAFKIVRYVKFTTDLPGSYYSSIFYVAMNQKKWDGLSKADQAAIAGVAGENLARVSGEVWDAGAAGVIKKLKAGGAQIETVAPAFAEVIRKKIAFVEQDWIKEAGKRGVDGKAALAYFRQQAAANK